MHADGGAGVMGRLLEETEGGLAVSGVLIARGGSHARMHHRGGGIAGPPNVVGCILFAFLGELVLLVGCG